MTYAAIDYLDQVVASSATVLEVGGGSSTVWWARRGNSVTTLEIEPSWASRIQQEAARHGVSSAITVHLIDPDNVLREIETLCRDLPQFDVVVNDGAEPRGSLVPALSGRVARGGVLVFDNSDRAFYAEAIAGLRHDGWSQLDLFGLGPINTYAWQTSVFFRTPPDVRGQRLRPKMISY